MAWNCVSESQLFTHSRIGAGSAQLFGIEDDERVLREALHTDELREQGVLRRILTSLDTPEARAARRTTRAAARPNEWLSACGDEAVDEVGALARRNSKDAPQHEVRVRRTQTSAVRGRLCPDLDAGARIISVVGSDLELSELAGHLIRIPIRGAGRQDDQDHDDDSASAASRAPTPNGNSEGGDYYIVLASTKNELELAGLREVRWDSLPALPAALPAATKTTTQVTKSKTTVVARHERAQRPSNSNSFACLQDEEPEATAAVTAQALANFEAFNALAPGTATEHQVAKTKLGIQGWAHPDRDAERVEEVDLHGCTTAEAIEQVRRTGTVAGALASRHMARPFRRNALALGSNVALTREGMA